MRIKYKCFSKYIFQEARMACKLLAKRFGIKDVSYDIHFFQFQHLLIKVGSWIKETDRNGDGKLSQREFSKSILAFTKESNVN